MSATDVEALTDEFTAAYATRDPEQIADWYTEDAVYDNVATETAYRGKDEIKGYVEKLFIAYPDFALELKNRYFAGDVGVAEFVMSGTNLGKELGHPGAGKPMQCRLIAVIELEDGKVKRHTLYYDRMTVLSQTGALPAIEELQRLAVAH